MSSFVGVNNGLGLSELRDQREALTLSAVLDCVQRKQLSQALDIICMRLQALALAKKKGGSWEKASKVELVADSSVDTLPAGLSGLAS